jgi:hypothetical protein
MTPTEGREEEVRKLNEELSALCLAQDGRLESSVITATHDSEEPTERAVNHQHSISLRSELHQAVKRRHADRSFFAP